MSGMNSLQDDLVQPARLDQIERVRCIMQATGVLVSMMIEPAGAAHLDHNRSFPPPVSDGSVSPTRRVLGVRGHEHRAA
eukprot:2644395-Pyramimonas_sp.AAC.1